MSFAERFKVEMTNAERGEVLKRHLSVAEKKFAEATETDFKYFGVETATYYCEWLLLLRRETAVEFLEALIGMHQIFGDEQAYEAAVGRFKAAKMKLHIELRLQSELN